MQALFWAWSHALLLRLQRSQGDAVRLPSMVPGAPVPTVAPAIAVSHSSAATSTVQGPCSTSGHLSATDNCAEASVPAAERPAVQYDDVRVVVPASGADQAAVCAAATVSPAPQGHFLLMSIIVATLLSAFLAFLTADQLRWLVHTSIFR